jgi:hypothetical protein
MSDDKRDATGGPVVEWAPFRAAPGVSEAAILAESDALQRDFLVGQRGFVRRELLRGDDGRWVDLVYWADRVTADEAMRAASASPTCSRYFQLMVGADLADPGAGVMHLRRVRTY